MLLFEVLAKTGIYTVKATKFPADRVDPGILKMVKNSENKGLSGWHVYMIRTARGQLYTGISTDVQRRLAEHEQGRAGAKSLRGKGPLALVWQCEANDRSHASQLEYRIKQLSRQDKERLVSGEITVDLPDA
jgi:putative endonuclease